jgi:hypothetical protein
MLSSAAVLLGPAVVASWGGASVALNSAWTGGISTALLETPIAGASRKRAAIYYSKLEQSAIFTSS